MKRRLYIALGSVFTALGLAGAFLPVLPTTPFLLLAIFFFMRSSTKGVKMILGNRYLAPYVKSYFSRKGIPVKTLLRILLFLWLTLGCCIIWCVNYVYLKVLLLFIGISVSVHLYLKREKQQ